MAEAGSSVRSLFFELGWDIEASKLASANAQVDALKTKASSMFKDTDKATKSLSASGSVITKQFKAASLSVEDVTDELTKADKKSDKFADSIEELGGETEKTKKSLWQMLKDTSSRFKSAKDDANKLGNALNDVGQEAKKAGKEIEKASKGASKFGKVAKFIGTATVAAITAVGAAAFAAGSSYEEHFKQIATGTGATGAELEELMASFKKLGSNSGEDLGAIAMAMTDVNKKLGLTGPLLEEYTTRIIGFGDLIGDDFAGLNQAVAMMAGSWDLTGKEAVNALDKLFVATQETGVNTVNLAERVTEFGSMMRNLGYDMDETIALFANWNKMGIESSKMAEALNSAIGVMSSKGIKNFSAGLSDIIAKVKAATAAEEANIIAMEYFGGEGYIMAEAIREGGFEVDNLVRSLANSENAIKKNIKRTETFADKLNKFKNQASLALAPVGEAMLDALGGVLDEVGPMLGDIAGSIAPLFETITPVIGEALKELLPIIGEVFGFINDIFKSFQEIDLSKTFSSLISGVKDILPIVVTVFGEIMAALKPIADAVIQATDIILPTTINIIGRVGGAIASLTEKLAPLFENMMPLIVDLLDKAVGAFSRVFGSVMPIVEQALPPLIDLVSIIIETILPPVIDLFSILSDTILPPVTAALNAITSALAPVIELFTQIFSVVLPPVMEVVKAVAGVLTGILQPALNAITPIVESIIKVFQGVIDFFKNIFVGNWQGVWDAVVSIFEGIFNGIVEIFKVPINLIIRGINFFIDGINSIKIPDWVPLVGGLGFNIPRIPELARGTDWFEGGIAIVGERGPELVTLPTGSGVMPNDETERLLSQTITNNAGDTYNITNEMQFVINASNADETILEQLRQELKVEIPRAINRMMKKQYIKNRLAYN